MRGLAALVVIATIVAAATFLAGHPGQVEIVWQGWQLDTSVGVLAAAFVVAVLAASSIIALTRGVLHLPRRWRHARQARRRHAGDAALTRGLVALAAGDAAAAARLAQRAGGLLDGAPLPLLLAAEAAQQQGDGAAARRFFAALLDRPDTAFLGLRGLFGEALRAGDDTAARGLAERAQLLQPAASWPIDNLVALEARAGDWEKARDSLAVGVRRGVWPAGRAHHHRGVILYELSRNAQARGDLRAAAGLAGKAQALAPDLGTLAAHHARLLIALGRPRRARKAIERAWRTAPHPDLARAYLEIHPADGPLARAAALHQLAAQNPDAAESRLAVAEAALAAQLWGEARRQLEIAAAAAPMPGPTRRLCLLMARLDESEPGGAGPARDSHDPRDWLDRAGHAPPDPCYVCARCGAETLEWHSVCRHCGSFDTLAWGMPARGISELAIRPAGPESPLMLPAPEASGAGPAIGPATGPATGIAPSGLAPP